MKKLLCSLLLLFILAVPALASTSLPGAVGGSLACTSNTGTTTSLSVSVAQNQQIFAWTTYSTGGGTNTTSMVFNTSENGTQAGTHFENSGRSQIYYWLTPTATTANVTITLDNSVFTTLCAFRTTGTGSVGTAVIDSDTGNPPSVTCSSAAGQTVVDFAQDSNAGTPTPGSGQTQIDSRQSSQKVQASYEAGAASVVMDWSDSSAPWYAGCIPLIGSADASVYQAITTTQHAIKKTTDTITATTAAADFSASNFVLAALSYNKGAGTPTISNSSGSTWTTTTRNCQSDSCVNFAFVCGVTLGASETFTLTDGSHATYPTVAVVGFAHVKASSCLDTYNTGHITSGATTLTPGLLTPGADNEIVFVAAMLAGVAVVDCSPSSDCVSGSFTVSDSTANDGTGEGIILAYAIQTSAATTNPTFTWGSSITAAAMSADFKAAVSVGVPSSQMLVGVGR